MSFYKKKYLKYKSKYLIYINFFTKNIIVNNFFIYLIENIYKKMKYVYNNIYYYKYKLKYED